MATPSTPTKERVRDGVGGNVGDQWRVIVLNDNHNTFDGVAFALAHVIPGVTFEGGLALANRIHNTGRAVVWTGHREPAELYWTELNDFGLTMAPFER
ncbi:MAG: ATP-dependent Clp protease adaptor ClpS [Actinomycetota bacterium]|nr:ATP-dependent Clp protease adaptor ClpS [Actinomycetota bacterium]